MEDFEVYRLFCHLIIIPQIDVEGNLQDGFERVISATLKDDRFHFRRTSDKRVTKLEMYRYYLGETLMEVITDIENTFPVVVTLTPNEENGYDISLEYRERSLEVYVD